MKEEEVSKGIGEVKEWVLPVLMILCCIIGAGYLISVYEDEKAESKKRDAIRLEQSRKNIHIAEDLVEREFDQNKKYFRLKTDSGTDTVYLHENTGYIWTNKHLEARLEMGKEKYVLYFHTKKVRNKDKKLDIYEPVELSKVLKEQEE
ncbi:hypothetical protein B4086_5559 [Bacillus cereus]|nr:hypothetical protein B4086_5559 [Bacillus cereus]